MRYSACFSAWRYSPTRLSRHPRHEAAQISDITTDTTNPPRFEVLARLRPRGRDDYPGPAVATLQRAAYPDIAPLELDVPVKVAYDAALALMTKRKWYIGDARAPTPGRREGVIEAVARTPIMGFRDDVVIRSCRLVKVPHRHAISVARRLPTISAPMLRAFEASSKTSMMS